MAANQKGIGSYVGSLENLCEEYLVNKAPALPENIKEAIVKFGPWISLILIIMSLPILLGFFGLGTFLMPFSYLGGLRMGFSYTASMVFTAIVLILELLALPGLFKRQQKGWYFMFYATIVEAVHNIVLFNLGGLIIGTLLGLYILFQIKSYYK